MTKTVLLLFTGLATIAAAPDAWGQERVTRPAQTDQTTTIEDVVVTARRREESLQDVPISVTAVSGETLIAQGVDKIENLSVPSLTITNNGTNRKTAGFALRGQRTNESQLLTDPPVGTYFAEVVQPRPFGFGYTLYDIANIQVLKGVQGTLFGRNVTGGAVLVTPEEPSDRFEAYAQASAGNFDGRQVEAMVNVPLQGGGALRLAGRTRQRDGYVHDVVSGQDFEGENYDTLRGSLKLQFGALSNLTTIDWLKADESGSAPIGTDYRTGNLAAVTPGIGCLSAVSTGVLTPFGATECLSRIAGSPVESPLAEYNASIARLASSDRLTVAMGTNADRQNGLHRLPFSNLENTGFTNRTVLTLNDKLQIKNIFGHRDIDFTRAQDLDGVPTFFIYAVQDTHIQQTSEELQLQGAAFEDRLNFTLGGYYFREEGTENSAPSSQFIDLTLGGAAASSAGALATNPAFQGQVAAGLSQTLIGRGLTPGSPAFTAAFNAGIGPAIGAAVAGAFPAVLQGVYGALTADDFLLSDRAKGLAETYAAYAAGTYHLNDVLSVSAGLRYTQDQRDIQIRPTAARPGGARICTYDPDGAGPGAALPVTNCLATSSLSNDAVTWDVTLQYEPDPGLTAYVSARKGFRSGGFSLRARNDAQLAPFLPETVQEYEVGLKNQFQFAAATLRTSAAVYFQDYSDVQKPVSQLVNGAVTTVITNTTAQENYGGELEASLTFFNGLSLSTYYSNAQADITEGGQPGAFVLQGVPEHQAGANISYDVQAMPSSVGELKLNANVSYKSLIHLDDLDASADQPAYTLVNLRAEWSDVLGSSVNIGFWANNVTDERYRTGVVSLLESAGTQASVFGEPRTYGLDVRYTF